jgi:hypothetical protein
MSEYEERQRDVAAYDAARERQWENYERDTDARLAVEHGWR